jgi:hypothetical protein
MPPKQDLINSSQTPQINPPNNLQRGPQEMKGNQSELRSFNQTLVERRMNARSNQDSILF